MNMNDEMTGQASGHPAAELSAVLIPLLKGVSYRADDAAHWSALLQLQGRVRDHVAARRGRRRPRGGAAAPGGAPAAVFCS
jgi:hypothetical protein